MFKKRQKQGDSLFEEIVHFYLFEKATIYFLSGKIREVEKGKENVEKGPN